MSYLFRHAGLDALKYYLPLFPLCTSHHIWNEERRLLLPMHALCVVRESLRVSHTHRTHTLTSYMQEYWVIGSVLVLHAVFPSFIPIGLQASLSLFPRLLIIIRTTCDLFYACVYTTPLCQPVCLALLHTVNTLHWPDEKRWIE